MLVCSLKMDAASSRWTRPFLPLKSSRTLGTKSLVVPFKAVSTCRSPPDPRRRKACWSQVIPFLHFTTTFIWLLDTPSPSVMAWHQKNSTNAAYTATDAAQSRPVCQFCVYGSMHQTRTDRYREQRPHTTIIGQQWSVDAYSHNRSTYRRKLYRDLFTDNGNGRTHCVYTKDRSSKELISQTSILFALHPAWQQRHENVDRFFRLDPENNYHSEAFKLAASAFGYRIEATAPRDKHANGIAERTVGVIAVKTNIAMLNPDPSVPDKFWCLSMEYACDTHSFNYHSRYGDSPYHLITGRQLYPVWCRCWVNIPLSDRHGKINAPRGSLR
jgi:hypothetical protein